MITFEEAKRKADVMLPGINTCTEYTNAWGFATKNSRFSIGGDTMPVIILKETGETADSTRCYDTLAGKLIQAFSC